MKLISSTAEQVIVELGTVDMFVNIPAAQRAFLHSEILNSVEQQLRTEFEQRIVKIPAWAGAVVVTGTTSRRGCIIVGLGIGVVLTTVTALASIVGFYPKLRAGLHQIASDIDHVVVPFDDNADGSAQSTVHYKTELPQPNAEDLAAIDKALRDIAGNGKA